MAEAKKAGEDDLSMEEILQSIRKIIAEDGEEAPVGAPAASAAPSSDVLELTEIMEELPAVAPAGASAAPVAAAPAVNDVLSKIDQVVVPDPVAAPAAAPAPAAAAAPVTPFGPPPATPAPQAPAAAAATVVANGQAYIDSLLSNDAASATSAAFKKIHPVETPIVTTPSPHLRTGGSVEDLILEALRPMLKNWLDMNLPAIVERIVEREIKKLVS